MINSCLTKYRDGIDEIDDKILELLKKRFLLSYSIAKYKKNNNIPIYDKKREELLIQRYYFLLNDYKYKDYLLNIMKEIISNSKRLQENN